MYYLYTCIQYIHIDLHLFIIESDDFLIDKSINSIWTTNHRLLNNRDYENSWRQEHIDMCVVILIPINYRSD